MKFQESEKLESKRFLSSAPLPRTSNWALINVSHREVEAIVSVVVDLKGLRQKFKVSVFKIQSGYLSETSRNCGDNVKLKSADPI